MTRARNRTHILGGDETPTKRVETINYITANRVETINYINDRSKRYAIVKRIGLLAVVVILLLAGCTGITVDSEREPYAVDEPVSPSPGDVLEGVEDGGIANAVELRTVHNRAVGTDGYRVETGVVVRELDGDAAFERQQTIARDSGHHSSHLVERQSGTLMGPVPASDLPEGDGTVLLERWESGEETFDMLDVDGSVEYDGDPRRSIATESVHLQTLSWVGDATAEVRQDEDGRYYRFETDQPASEARFSDESFTAVVYVSEDGVITAFELTGETTDTGTPIEVTVTWSLTDRGDVTLEEPEWVETAREETTRG